MATPLLSNPVLDELYAIRRILVGQHMVHSKVADPFAKAYYAAKIDAMDKAIAAFIVTDKVPLEHTEQAATGPAFHLRMPAGTNGETE